MLTSSFASLKKHKASKQTNKRELLSALTFAQKFHLLHFYLYFTFYMFFVCLCKHVF